MGRMVLLAFLFVLFSSSLFCYFYFLLLLFLQTHSLVPSNGLYAHVRAHAFLPPCLFFVSLDWSQVWEPRRPRIPWRPKGIHRTRDPKESLGPHPWTRDPWEVWDPWGGAREPTDHIGIPGTPPHAPLSIKNKVPYGNWEGFDKTEMCGKMVRNFPAPHIAECGHGE